jgi:hypothetical protein
MIPKSIRDLIKKAEMDKVAEEFWKEIEAEAAKRSNRRILSCGVLLMVFIAGFTWCATTIGVHLLLLVTLTTTMIFVKLEG